jgi:hypothetical protein
VSNAPPVIVRPIPVRKDRLFKRLARQGRATAVLTPAAPPRPMRQAISNGHRVVPEQSELKVLKEWSSDDHA